MSRVVSAFLAISFAVLAGCGGGGDSDGDTTGPGDDDGSADVAAEVTIEDDAFVDPQGNRNTSASVTVSVGETVRWTYVSSGTSNHTVTSGEGSNGDSGDGVPAEASESLTSGTMTPGDTYSFTFDTPGTWTYYCQTHPTVMYESTVVVESN